MRQYYLAVAVLVSTALAGCGGGSGSSDLPAKPKFTSQITFGDSLSDVGSYKVGGVAALGGGQFTINIPGVSTNWTEMIAPQLGLGLPCAAVTGGFGSAATPRAGCYGYAQGGARVTVDAGIGNVDGGYLAPGTAYTKAMTFSIARQIAMHVSTLTSGSFNGSELIFVLAGANDVLTQVGTYPVLQGAPYNLSAQVALQTVTAATTLAADQLATQVIDQLVAKGAKYIVVINVPDIANTPFGVANGASGQALIDGLVRTFNAEIKTKLAGNANVLLVDAYTANHDELTRPTAYGLTNITDTACNIAPASYLATNFPNSTGTAGSSLGCTPTAPLSMTTGVAANTHYLFADDVHPTPYGHALFSLSVLQAMTNKGWY